MVVPGVTQPVTVPPQPPPVAVEPPATLRVLCPNGHELFAEADQVGRKLRCPACKIVMVIPGAPPSQVTATPPPLPPPVVEEPPEALRVLCPNGHELHATPDQIGRKIRCPACKVVMVVPDPNPQVSANPLPKVRRPPVTEELFEEHEPLEEDEGPRQPGGLKKRQRMARVNLGLAFHFWKVFCLLAAVSFMLIAEILARIALFRARVSANLGDVQGAAEAFRSAVPFLMTLLMILGIVLLVAMVAITVLGFVGSLFCLWIPKKARSARPLIIASFALDCAAFALVVVAVLMYVSAGARAAGGLEFSGGSIEAGLVLEILSKALAFVAWILFMLFLSAVAYYLHDSGTGDEAKEVMVLGIVVGFGGAVILTVLLVALMRVPQVNDVVQGIGQLVWMIWMIRILFRSLQLISTLRAEVSRRS